jgi:hypothetical protein
MDDRLDERCGIDADPALDHRLVDRVALEHLAGVEPQVVDAALHPPAAFLGPVAEPHHPVAAAAQVIVDLLQRLRRDPGDPRVGRARQAREQQVVEHVEIELARDRHREVAVRLLEEQQVAEGAGIAQVRELVLVAAAAFDLARERQPHPRLAEQVERDIADGELLLDRRTVADAFGQPVAEDEAVVAQAQQVIDQRIGGSHDLSILHARAICRSRVRGNPVSFVRPRKKPLGSRLRGTTAASFRSPRD